MHMFVCTEMTERAWLLKVKTDTRGGKNQNTQRFIAGKFYKQMI